jgi:ribosomal protein S26
VTAYIVCRNCGKYVPVAEAVHRGEGAGAPRRVPYCSDDCMRGYASCENCGKFFLRGKGFDSEHCTRECTVRYQILRKYGPEPVTVVTEV